MSRCIPMPAYPDSMPVDISFVFEDEKPAGKHGFLKADGEVMRFEDGALAKFWGVNFNGGACFPDKEYAPKVARRLAMAGCNIVRLHQLDAEWDTPNIFAYTKGKRVTTTRVLDPKSMDALDYLIYCLKQEGIYIYLDMMTYRKFKEGDGVEDHEILQDLGKPWCMFDEKMIELQKEYATNLWTHYNPYTGLQYKDDPAFVMSEVAAECDLFHSGYKDRVDYIPPERYIRRFRLLLRSWLAEKGLEYDWENCDLYTTDVPIETSGNMLLSAIGRAWNTDFQMVGNKMLNVGHAPIVAEVIEADVSIRTDIGDKLRVWGVNAEGFYAGKLATKYEDGILSFHIGEKNNPACYYLIVKE